MTATLWGIKEIKRVKNDRQLKRRKMRKEEISFLWQLIIQVFNEQTYIEIIR